MIDIYNKGSLGLHIVRIHDGARGWIGKIDREAGRIGVYRHGREPGPGGYDFDDQPVIDWRLEYVAGPLGRES